jgi:hypothetical protein
MKPSAKHISEVSLMQTTLGGGQWDTRKRKTLSLRRYVGGTKQHIEKESAQG